MALGMAIVGNTSVELMNDGVCVLTNEKTNQTLKGFVFPQTSSRTKFAWFLLVNDTVRGHEVELTSTPKALMKLAQFANNNPKLFEEQKVEPVVDPKSNA